MNVIRQGFKVSDHINLNDRTLVGFDLRRESSINHIFMTSYDEISRYEKINEEFTNDQSGLNIFNICPDKISGLTLPKDARIIAFDLPTEYVNYLSHGTVSNPTPLPIEKIDHRWKFIGFDIVDAMTQTSALYGFDFTWPQLEKIAEKNLLRFNINHLVDRTDEALRLVIYFNQIIPEHSPFLPCGIWLKIK